MPQVREQEQEYNHRNSTLRRIDELANDIEMQAPTSENVLFIVVDTNILLNHFEAITKFVEEAEVVSEGQVKLVIPGAVIYELDGQKQRPELGWFSRRASTWLLKKIKGKNSVKGQANDETCNPSRNWKVRQAGETRELGRLNDGLILDCCRFFSRKHAVFLCSEDKNLCIEAHAEGIMTLEPTKCWCSRDIARALGGGHTILSKFSGYRASYGGATISGDASKFSATTLTNEDQMDIDPDDDEGSPLPSHPLDLLHLQIIEHFTRLLIDLVARVGGVEVLKPDLGTISQYAPEWKRLKRPCTQWNSSHCLEYLGAKKSMRRTSPRVDIFLSVPYSCRGGRRGQDWSRRDWEVCLEALVEIGDDWQESSFRESTRELAPHLGLLFKSVMRPTGL